MKTLLLKPFERYSETRLLLVGLLAFAVGTVLSKLFNTHFDGVLDAHFSNTISWTETILNNTINVVCLTAILFAVGKIINHKTRLVDLLATVLIARIPFYPLVFCNVGNKAFKSGDELVQSAQHHTQVSTSAIVMLVIMVLITLALIVWSVSLLYNGYKTAVNGKGTKAIVFFIAAIVVAEIISKVVIVSLSNTLKL